MDARALMRHVLGVDDAYLIAHAGEPLSHAHGTTFAALVARRTAGEPVAYIVGTREFFSVEFKVTPAVLIPRPETELLVEIALECTTPEQACRVLDLGTGSGCVAISIARHRPRARVVAVDLSAAALAVATENAACHAVSNLELLVSDWFAALGGERFDVIVSNPPYVAADDPHLLQGDLRYEPASALTGGRDGLDSLRAIVVSAPQHLNSGGTLAVEHGHNQGVNCRELFAAAGFSAVSSRTDLAGIERVTLGRWHTSS